MKFKLEKKVIGELRAIKRIYNKYYICTNTEGFHYNSGLILWQSVQFSCFSCTSWLDLYRHLMIWLYLVLQFMELTSKTVIHFREPTVSTAVAFPTEHAETVNLVQLRVLLVMRKKLFHGI